MTSGLAWYLVCQIFQPSTDHRCRAIAFVVEAQRAAQYWTLADEVERVGRYECTGEPLGGVLLVGHIHRLFVVATDAFECSCASLPVAQFKVGEAVLSYLRVADVPHAEGDDAVRRVEGKIPKQDAVGEGKDGAIRRDAERERHDGGAGESRAAAKTAEGVLEICVHDS